MATYIGKLLRFNGTDWDTFDVVPAAHGPSMANHVQGLAQFFSYSSLDGGLSPDSVVNNAHVYITGISLFGQTDGALYAQAYSSVWVHEIYGDYRTGQMAVRGHRGDTGVWTAWRVILDSVNFGTYVTPAAIGAQATLVTGYGDTLNPYASKTAKYVLAAPNAAAGVPVFRQLIASDIPTLLALAGGTVTGQVQYTPTTLATTGTVNLDFAGANLRTQGALTGNITYTASNYAAGRSITIRVLNGTTLRTLTFPATWGWVGTKPANIAASKVGILTITSFGASEATCVAAWAVQS